MNAFTTPANLSNSLGSNVATVFLLITIIGGAFFLWMVVDCALKESPENNLKLVWMLIILFVPLGSLIYFFVRKLPRPPASLLAPPVLHAVRRDCPHCGVLPETNAVVCPVCGGPLANNGG